mmetsp:Transcript_10070/g.13128  ORF Transcript_10070/g.13128 Transcript_10070/m.13128 type:complete len:210 (-) Transcript_10070:169-798(-)
MEGTGSDRVQGQIELIIPTEFKSRLGQRVIAILSSGQTLGQVSCMGSDFVSNDTSLNIITVGETQMLLGSDVTEHGSSKGGNVGSTNSRGNVIITWCDIRSKRTKSVEGCLHTPFKLVSHIFRNLVEGDMSRTFIHDLDILFPGTFGQFTLSPEFSELSLVVGIVDGTRAKSVTNGEGNIVLGTNIKNFIPMFVSKVFLVVENIPLGVD